MNEFWLGAAAGTPTGGAIAVLVTVAILRHRAATPPLTEQDREVVTHEFRTHAEAMHQQVSEYADALAGGDMVLRERLRQFEASR